MPTICVYAEKPDIGYKITAALTGGFPHNGKTITMSNIESEKASFKDIERQGYQEFKMGGSTVYVTWGKGHMCELYQAYDYNPEYASWSKLPVPFIPEKYKIKIKEGYDWKKKKKTGKPDPRVAAQLKVIKGLFTKSDVLMLATDDDREGDLIVSYVLEQTGVKGKACKRVLFSSLTEEGIKKSFHEAVPFSQRTGIVAAGRCRAIADWLSGANITVAMTMNYKKKIEKLGYLSVGRVQTAVLTMVVERELAIRNFVSKPFWNVEATFTTQNGEVYEGKYDTDKMESAEAAEEVISRISGQPGIIKEVVKTPTKKDVPLLYNLSALQKEANELYGYTAAKTLEYVQSMYEAGFCTYPRTESQHINEDMRENVDEILDMLSELSPKYAQVISLVPKDKRNYTKRHFDDSKVESHYAIIPTKQAPKNLSDEEKRIYHLIALSVIRIIFKPASGEKTDITTEVNGELFKTTGTIITDPQWLVAGTEKKEKVFLPDVTEGETVSGEYSAKEGKTEPPKHFTDSTLLSAMKNASRNIDDEELKAALNEKNKGGIGRPSTQANIIETITQRYCQRKGKNIIPTDDAIRLIGFLPIDDFKSAEMTASWEMKLDKLEKNEMNPRDFISEIEDAVRKWVQQIYDDAKGPEKKIDIPPARKSSGAKPTGKKDTSDNKPFRGTNREKPAEAEPENQGISHYESKENNGEEKQSFSGYKKGNTYKKHKSNARELNEDIVEEDDFEEEISTEELICPACGSPLIPTFDGYICSANRKGKLDSCRFSINYRLGGIRLSDSVIKSLVTTGTSERMLTFRTKHGGEYKGTAILDEKYRLKIVTPAEEEGRLICPNCGGDVNETDKFWKCENSGGTCRFVVPKKFEGKTISEKHIKELCEKGETAPIFGFRVESGGAYTASLVVTDLGKVLLSTQMKGRKANQKKKGK